MWLFLNVFLLVTETHTHTHNRFTALWILSGTTWMRQYQKKHSPTHTYHGHHIPYLLPPSITIHASFHLHQSISIVLLLPYL